MSRKRNLQVRRKREARLGRIILAQPQKTTQADGLRKRMHRTCGMAIIDDDDDAIVISSAPWKRNRQRSLGWQQSASGRRILRLNNGDGEDAAKDATFGTHVIMLTGWGGRNVSSSSLHVRVLLPAPASIVASSMLSLPYTIYYPLKPWNFLLS